MLSQTREIAIRRTEIDGIPTFFGQSESHLTRAALIFRVGTADEHLPVHGISHLVEHLALRGVAGRSFVYNGQTELNRTIFYLEGSNEEVVDFFATVTSTLSDLPVQSIDDERRVLRTEQESRPNGSPNGRLSTRFGAGGYGVGDYLQYGLQWLDADAVREWTRRWFNSRNCALLLANEPPDGLRLHLPLGERHPTPRIQPLAFEMPAVTDSGHRGVAISLLGRRAVELLVGALCLDRRVRMRVRHEKGLSYAVGAQYFALDDESAELIAHADSTQENVREATNSILATIAEFQATGPTLEEIDGVVEGLRREQQRPEHIISELDRAATDELTGMTRPSWQEMSEQIASLAPEAVAMAVAEAARQMIVIVPEATPLDFEGLVAISVQHEVVGTLRLDGMPGKDNTDTLYIGPEGASLVTRGHPRIFAVKWHELAVAMWWNDGRRTILGRDGMGINFFPDRWLHAHLFAQALYQYVPRERWVPMDEPGTQANK